MVVQGGDFQEGPQIAGLFFGLWKMNIRQAIEFLQSSRGFMMLIFQENKKVSYDATNQAKPIVVESGDFQERLPISEFEHAYGGNRFREMTTDEIASL